MFKDQWDKYRNRGFCWLKGWTIRKNVKLLRRHLRPTKLTKLKRIPWLSLRLCIFLSTFTFLPWAEEVEIIIINLQIKKLRSEKIEDFPSFTAKQVTGLGQEARSYTLLCLWCRSVHEPWITERQEDWVSAETHTVLLSLSRRAPLPRSRSQYHIHKMWAWVAWSSISLKWIWLFSPLLPNKVKQRLEGGSFLVFWRTKDLRHGEKLNQVITHLFRNLKTSILILWILFLSQI